MRLRIWPRAHGRDRQITAWIDEAALGGGLVGLLSTGEHSHDNGKHWCPGGSLTEFLDCEVAHRPCAIPAPHVCAATGPCNGLPRKGA